MLILIKNPDQNKSLREQFIFDLNKTLLDDKYKKGVKDTERLRNTAIRKLAENRLF